MTTRYVTLSVTDPDPSRLDMEDTGTVRKPGDSPTCGWDLGPAGFRSRGGSRLLVKMSSSTARGDGEGSDGLPRVLLLPCTCLAAPTELPSNLGSMLYTAAGGGLLHCRLSEDTSPIVLVILNSLVVYLHALYGMALLTGRPYHLAKCQLGCRQAGHGMPVLHLLGCSPQPPCSATQPVGFPSSPMKAQRQLQSEAPG